MKDNTTGGTANIRHYESTYTVYKYVTHDIINDGTTDLTYNINPIYDTIVEFQYNVLTI